MGNGVGNRGGDSSNSNLADALNPEGASTRVILFNQNRIDRGNIQVGRNKSFGEISVYPPSNTFVGHGFFHQCLANAPDHGASDLTAGELRIDNPPGTEGTHQMLHTHFAGLRIYIYLGELCSKGRPGITALSK